ncbi:MAG: RluA family pseudouridine synthase [Saprospiraceae bacterium]|jgi:23S rRNA pseudouridine1911/1915/1917 synthase|nr:RluA family pseudouridine synthase [Saprospiraceae bacterium]MBK7607528.1 RluA family pseudouridine synthase [Saprospiraceae bacterium]MBK8511105.1 RluA family pseudouridine synthase [Saprospiraceae bacterium]MBK8778026.1 RluA family pseudouridine synthase [Saprospiraceae bacterium]MBK9930025.1 RluA family pseudouridine synthase [Saprospiraceae bacterium]
MISIKDGIILSNHHFIAYNKPGGIAVQSVQNKEDSLEVKLQQYCKVPLHLIHRIDQPCTGVVLFAKKKPMASYLNELLQSHDIERTYLAIVQGKPEKEKGSLHHFLFAHKKSNKSYVVDEKHKEGKPAQLDYEWIRELPDQLHLLQIKLHTGRHHQIRAQLGDIGCPIFGDIKYGARSGQEDRSICLHAWKLSFKHPIDHKTIAIEAPPPVTGVWQHASLK